MEVSVASPQSGSALAPSGPGAVVGSSFELAASLASAQANGPNGVSATAQTPTAAQAFGVDKDAPDSDLKADSTDSGETPGERLEGEQAAIDLDSASAPQGPAVPEVSELLTNLDGVWSSSPMDWYGWSMQASLSGFQMSQGEVQFVRTSSSTGPEAFSLSGSGGEFSLETLAGLGSVTPASRSGGAGFSGAIGQAGATSDSGLVDDLNALRESSAQNPSGLNNNAFTTDTSALINPTTLDSAAGFIPSEPLTPEFSGPDLFNDASTGPSRPAPAPSVPAVIEPPPESSNNPGSESEQAQDVDAAPEPPAAPVNFAIQAIQVDENTTEVVGTNGNNVLVWDSVTVGTASMGQGFNELSAPDSADLTMSYAWAASPVQADLLSGVGIVWDDQFIEVLAFDALSGGWNHLIGGAGHDSLAGNARPNRLDGGVGNDVLLGLEAADTLSGGRGDDLLILESGLMGDVAIGGDGNDIFFVAPSSSSGDGQAPLSRITDFDLSANEQIIFARSPVLAPVEPELLDLMRQALPVGFSGQAPDAPYWLEGSAITLGQAEEHGRRLVVDAASEVVTYESFDVAASSWTSGASVQVTGLIGLNESDGFLLSSKFFDFG